MLVVSLGFIRFNYFLHQHTFASPLVSLTDDIVVEIMPNFKDVQRLQNQCIGYSYNLAGGAPPNVSLGVHPSVALSIVNILEIK